MFKDLRNRTLHLGDLIIYDFNCPVKELAYGVLLSENKVAYLYDISVVRKETFCFLIENPDENERKLKEQIIVRYKEVMNEQVKTDGDKVKFGTSYESGDILEDSNGYSLYLGEITLTDMTDGQLNLNGHAYINIPSNDTNNINYKTYSYLKNQLDEYVIIETNNQIYGDFTGSYNLKINKRKSGRFISKVGHIDMNEFNYSYFKCNIIEASSLSFYKIIKLQLKLKK